MSEMKTRGAVARYLRLGETFVGREPGTELRTDEVGSTGGLVARYLKIEHDDRPATAVAKQRPPRKSRRPARKPRPVVVIDEGAVVVGVPVKEHRFRVHHGTPKAQQPQPHEQPSKRPRLIQCPDCEAKIPAGTDQCPSCALFLDKVA